jgi:hypothetical protein
MIQISFVLLSTNSARMPYLDPGTGSFLIQLLIAGLLAVGVLLRLFWGRITKLFTKIKFKKDNNEDDGQEEDDE